MYQVKDPLITLPPHPPRPQDFSDDSYLFIVHLRIIWVRTELNFDFTETAFLAAKRNDNI